MKNNPGSVLNALAQVSTWYKFNITRNYVTVANSTSVRFLIMFVKNQSTEYIPVQIIRIYLVTFV
jgi:hypothetical protein